MEKVIRDGKVAVLYSPGFGAGWYTWHHCLEAVFHPKLVELVEQNKHDEITEEFMESIIPGFEGYMGGARDLEIEWIHEGLAFKIDEYDGNESISIVGDESYLTA